MSLKLTHDQPLQLIFLFLVDISKLWIQKMSNPRNVEILKTENDNINESSFPFPMLATAGDNFVIC